MLKDNEAVALVIEHKVRPGAVERYEKWLAEILELTKKSPGYIGREIFPPAGAGEPYLVILRFQTDGDLRTWLNSKERKRFIQRISDEFEEGDKTEIRAGIDVWFTPTGQRGRRPLPYKQFIVTFAAIYPLTLLIPFVLSPLFETFPVLKNSFLGNLIVTATIVGLVTYLIMPRLTKWLQRWLFSSLKPLHLK